MRLIFNRFFFICFFTLTVVSLAHGQDQILSGGELAGYKIWRGSIVIQGDVTIPEGSQLNIEPGTRIYFSANRDDQRSGNDKTRAELIVRGKLIARGTADNKIVFSSKAEAPRMGDWYGIQFLHNQAGCGMEYCVVEYAYNGVTIKNTGLLLANCEIRYNYNSGIRTEVKADPQIVRSIISENGYAGLVSELGAKPVLTDNLISQNPMGVVVMSLSEPNLGSLADNTGYNPGRNQFVNNEDYDLYNHSSKPVMAQNNTWDSGGRPKLYDQQDNRKYGAITYNPRLNQGSSGNLLLLAQNTTARTAPPAIPVASNNQNPQRGPAAENASTGTDTTSGTTVMDTLLENALVVDLASSAQPLLASASGPTPDMNHSPVDISEINNVIDYNQVFLEPFLDSRRKRVIWKEKLVINETLSKVLEPGEVRVKVIVAENGRVESANILRGINPILDDAILESVKKYRYEPGTVNGKSVRFSTNEVFRFK